MITGTDFENGFVNLSTCHYVAKERYLQDPHIQVDENSILITKDGTLGKVAIIDKIDKPATLNAGVFNVRISDSTMDYKYVYHYLKGPFLLDYISLMSTGGTIKHLNQNILVDFKVTAPDTNEQRLISRFFSDIDSLITLHQRKHFRETASISPLTGL